MLFHDITVLNIPLDGITVQWMIAPQDTNLNDVEVVVQRSGGINGPWSDLAVVDPNNVFMFKDVVAPHKPDEMGIYYRLLGRDRGSQVVIETSEAFTDSRICPRYAQEIKRQIRILLEGVNGHEPFVGRRCTVYKLRRFGPRCRSCRDASTGLVAISNCNECGGTGFRGDGYFNPVDTFCRIDPEVKQLQFLPVMKTDDRQTRVLMTDVPIMYPGDVLVEKNEKHWRVDTVELAEDNERNTVVQFPAVVEIERGDVVYSKLRHSDNGGLRP